ncbi:MAG: hypothetical protein L3J42_03510 [Hydrogenimonas sp.]|nr:hypothetical protein [Hydrogenimonas sp.]
MVIYLAAALFLLLLAVLLARAYRADRRVSTLLIGSALIGAAFFYTYFTRTMLVYKPILVLHIALTLYCWYGVFLYLLKRKLNRYAILSPLGSILLFFAVAYYFKEQ